MSMGLNALRAIVDAGSLTAFRKLQKNWFTEDELPDYEAIRAHVKRYAAVPDMKAVKEMGIKLPSVSQPARYYLDRLAQRAVYNSVNETHPALLDAMRGKDVEAVKAALHAMVRATREVDARDDYSTLAEQAGLILSLIHI